MEKNAIHLELIESASAKPNLGMMKKENIVTALKVKYWVDI